MYIYIYIYAYIYIYMPFLALGVGNWPGARRQEEKWCVCVYMTYKGTTIDMYIYIYICIWPDEKRRNASEQRRRALACARPKRC